MTAIQGKPAFWLRCETKPLERRAALTPTTAKALIDSGFDVYVERDEQRIFQDSDYEIQGCILVPHNSWPSAPFSVPIIGLKDLPVSLDLLRHTHIHFAHCYKHQAGWASLLQRFHLGGGTLYDLEFLEDADTGRRIAAFGFHAGFAGAAVGALAFGAQNKGEVLEQLVPYDNEAQMIEDVKSALPGGSGKGIKVLVIGALGRCGSGAVDLFRKIGVEEYGRYRQMGHTRTAKGGPFQEILDADIFVNCIYLREKIPPFLTKKFIKAQGERRRLSVVVDISCDATNPFNPLPIYSVNTTFTEPTALVDIGPSPAFPPLSIVAIDHTPSFLPREASEQFSANLLSILKRFPERHTAITWTEAEKLFKEKVSEALGVERN
ncbi:Formate/glycerate dehydrogenase catalytic domain-like protein [Gymnopus androsaceus JB14]|uniref:Saccharopine dehydrogenase [NAD(+), L-lysine-forming] n=1 Tax=Gymnopus androsaceus JB14 TaxID=1447944 RepID=A0A6A4H8G8_9AGAR|nr:Formate/glycerate dehydrogenase catalytic domain-like protein [Gymnopus androsaceus JB14]